MATNRAARYPGRWGAVSADYPMGVPKNRTSDTAKDGSYFEKDWIADYEAFFGALLDEAGQTVNGTTDTAQNSQLHKAMQLARQVEPLNGSYNGYMDPEHQSSLPAPNGYPGNSGGGEASYDTDDEISYGIFSATDSNSVSSDSDGWIFTGAIYKQETLTTAQMALFDEDTLPVFVKDQDGNAYSLKNGDTGVTVSIVGTTATITISSDIFTGSLTKLWRFFVTEKVGYIGELSPDALFDTIGNASRSDEMIKIITQNSNAVIYPSVGGGYADTSGSYTSPSAATHMVVNAAEGLVLVAIKDGPATGTITALDTTTSPMTATIGGDNYDLLRIDLTTLKSEIDRSLSVDNLYYLQESYASGTSGGTSVAGYNKRSLNTEVVANISGAYLSSGDVVLPAGKYFISAATIGYNCDDVKTSIYNVTSALHILPGLSNNTAASGTSTSILDGYVEFSEETPISVYTFITSAAPNGLGFAVDSGDAEVYADIKIWKV